MSDTQQNHQGASAEERIIDFDAVIIGAGFSGLYALHKLRNEMGLSARVFEAGGGTGTAIRARAAIRPVGSTATRSMRSFARNGSGANATPNSKRC
jgi:cation diffusion facilitator CzcD-associated flavoprotein CzcO